jgi:hypothetical protein
MLYAYGRFWSYWLLILAYCFQMTDVLNYPQQDGTSPHKKGDGALVQQWLEKLPCWSQQLSLAVSCSAERLNGELDGRLDNGLKGNGGHGNEQWLSSADFCLLTTTYSLDDGGCRDGLTDGSSNGSTD